MSEEFISGQLDAQRLAIMALVVQSRSKEQFLLIFRELYQRLQGDLLAHPIAENRLDGIAAEVLAIEQLLTATAP